jgi:hypothetical protein
MIEVECGSALRMAQPYFDLDLLRQVQNETFHIYPNPASGKVFISRKISDSQTTIEFLDALGNVVFSKIISSKTLELDISKINPGLYLVKLTDANGKEMGAKKLFVF